jgi:RimJ/RimL family protein N-acetyltransferase
MSISYHRLTPADAAIYRALRLEGLTLHPRDFRSSPEDEPPVAVVSERLATNCFVGAFADDTLVGIGGLIRETRLKVRHKATLVGMYVTATARGHGIADAIIARLLDHARDDGVTLILLTVIAENARARRVYERCGFTVYGIEPIAVRFGDRYLDEALMCRRLD